MKKLFIIALMLAYAASASGIQISLHFCCGKLDNISFSGKQHDSCNMGNHLNKNGCCIDQQIVSSLNADQQQATKLIQPNRHHIQESIVVSEQPQFRLWSRTNSFNASEIRPRYFIPLFLKNCVFRI